MIYNDDVCSYHRWIIMLCLASLPADTGQGDGVETSDRQPLTLTLTPIHELYGQFTVSSY